MAMDDMGMMSDEMGSAPDAAAPLDDFAAAVQDAFPAEDWTPDRTAALKDAIRICLEEDQSGGYDKEKPSGGPDLALVLGPPPKKKS